MMTSNPYLVYKNQDIETAGPRELVTKLLNTAVISLRKAEIAIREKRFESANNDFLKAENILCALDGSLDMNYPIAVQLHQLYDHLLKGLAKANVSKDISAAGELTDMIAELRDTWSQAVRSSGDTEPHDSL